MLCVNFNFSYALRRVKFQLPRDKQIFAFLGVSLSALRIPRNINRLNYIHLLLILLPDQAHNYFLLAAWILLLDLLQILLTNL